MCDENTQQDFDNYMRRRGHISRRQFGALTAGASLASLLPPVANAQEISERHVEISTPDGVADCHFAFPVGGTSAAVLVWPDILGLRPAFEGMGRRLAESGYAVLTVNPFYRSAKAPVVDEGATFGDPEVRNTVFALAGELNKDTHFTDAEAFIFWLDAQSEVDTAKGMGTTGYCMGGPMVMHTVAAVPSRVRAGATFHGGGIATGGEDSPLLGVLDKDVQMLHAIAANDHENEPEVRTRLIEGYADAGIEAEVEVYEGTQHGWCPTDSQAYHMEQAERAWSRLLVLFDSALG